MPTFWGIQIEVINYIRSMKKRIRKYMNKEKLSFEISFYRWDRNVTDAFHQRDTLFSLQGLYQEHQFPFYLSILVALQQAGSEADPATWAEAGAIVLVLIIVVSGAKAVAGIVTRERFACAPWKTCGVWAKYPPCACAICAICACICNCWIYGCMLLM